MHFTVSYDRPQDDTPRSGPVRVGWLLTAAKSAIVYDPPERVRSVDMSRTHAKSASRCPAVINLESRYFVIKCPFDLALRFVRGDKGEPGIRNMLGEKSPIRGNKLREILHVTDETEWRYKDRPTIQMALPYLFIADEPVHMSQVAPFMHYRSEPMPGTIFGGRFPIDVWPRPLMWAFEWHEPEKDIVLKRGEPLFYAMFETAPPERAVQLVEAEKTAELQKYLDSITGVVNYVNQTFSLFQAAQKIRPETLVVPVKR